MLTLLATILPLLVSATQKTSLPCSSLLNSSHFPCDCYIETENTISVNCDDIVFQGEVPVLPYRLPLVAFSQKRVGYQSLGTQLFTASKVPIRLLDFSQNRLLRLTERVFEGLEESLQDLRLNQNSLGDQLNPIFSTNEFNSLVNLRVLELSSNQIKALDDNIFQGNGNLRELYLQDNDLERVPTTAFRFLKSLQELNLQHNALTLLPAEAFSTLNSLTLLNLSANFISNIENNAFVGLSRLQILVLSANQISNLNDHTFAGVESLDTLDLSNNLLTSVPSGPLSKLANLTMLLLTSNKLQMLDSRTFQDLPTLTFLDLSRNRILNIPPDVFSPLSNLQEIHLDVNLVRKLDEDAFGGLRKLEVLSLDDNLLLAIPSTGLSRLENLHALTINFNRITALSADILHGLRFLEELSIQNNLIREIPEGTFDDFRALQVLDLNGNHIEVVTDATFTEIRDSLVYLDLGNNKMTEFVNVILPSLEILILSRNKISSVKNDTFPQMTEIFDLDLQSNKIEIIDESAFANLQQLQTLQLQDNLLQKIPDGVFSHLNLKLLNLSNNNLQILEERTFHNLSLLEAVDLSSNNIATIRKGAFSLLPTLRHIILSGNKLTTFKGDVFDSLTILENLDLSKNHISYLYPDSFVAHSQLRTLNLSQNRLSFFPAEIIRQIKSLVTIDLHGNQLQTLDDSDFGGMQHLRVLDLSFNNIRQLSETAFQNSSQLQFLNLSNNFIDKLHSRQFLGIHRLNLDLSRNNLSDLPEDIFDRGHLSHLEEIDLSRNYFQHPPTKALQKQYFFLQQLDLSRNNIKDIPPSANILINIKYLDLSFNPLSRETIQHILTTPKTVRYLNLAHANVREISTLEMPFLQYLNLSSNRIDNLTVSLFQRVTRLQNLDLSHNHLSGPIGKTPEIWMKLRNLKYLDLSDNFIEQISNGVFDALDKLQTLKLNDLVKLTRFEDDVLKNLKQLQDLEISNYPTLPFLHLKSILEGIAPLHTLSIELKSDSLNDQIHNAYSPRLRNLHVTGRSLQNIATNAFAGISSTDLSLSITNTSINTLLPSIFFSLPMSSTIHLNVARNQLQQLSPQLMNLINERGDRFLVSGLQENPLNCDCNMRPMFRWLRENNQIQSLSCVQPNHLKEKLIVDLDAEELVCAEQISTTSPAVSITTPVETTTMTTTTEEPIRVNDVIYEQESNPSLDSVRTANKNSSLNTMDSMIIGIIVGVVAIVCIIIVIVCVVKLRHVQSRQRFLQASSALANGQHCTCRKSTPPLSQYNPNYPPHSVHPGGPHNNKAYQQTLSRNGFYGNTPYYVTYPESERGHR